MKLSGVFCLLCAAILSTAGPAHADAGWISIGGDVQPLSENPTVVMKSEVVDVVVGREVVRVDCRYVFANEGPACRVRMGFPDEASEVDIERRKQSPFGTFLTYDAYVEGKSVPVETVVETAKSGRSKIWHANYVDFLENQTINVRNVYTTCPNVTGVSSDNCSFVIGYILSTAASWHGKLDSAEINITFEKDVLPEPLQLVSYESLQDEDSWKKTPRGAVCCDAPVTPSLSGRTIRLRLKDRKFGSEDDITVVYGHINERQGDRFIENVRKKLIKEAIRKKGLL